MQQMSPAEFPHFTHTEPTPVPLQRVSGAVQREPVQQGWPGPPQVPQLPAEQVPSSGAHELPPATHLPLAQQPSPRQLLPAQQIWPVAPHWDAGIIVIVSVFGGPSPSGPSARTGASPERPASGALPPVPPATLPPVPATVPP